MSFLFFATAAFAEPHGLVARLQLNGETIQSTAAVLLKPVDGELTRIELADNGTPPDVTKGDGMWAGSTWLEGDVFSVQIEVDGKVTDGGSITWDAGDSNRDLTITMKGGQIGVEAGVSGSPGGGPAPGEGGPAAVDPGAPGASPGAAVGGVAPVGGPGDSLGAAPTGGPPGGGSGGALPPGSPPGVVGAAKTGAGGSLYIGFGLGLTLLVVVVALWLRNRPATIGEGGLPRVPEPGLLGPGSPSLSDGLHLWITPEADADALVRPLLATLARHHRVLFVAPGKVQAPSVHGGPVYRATNIRPTHVGDAAEAIERNGNVTVLLVGTQADAGSLKDYADLLPTGVGSVCLLTADPGVPAIPRVTARRDGEVWVVQTSDRVLRLRELPSGFEGSEES